MDRQNLAMKLFIVLIKNDVILAFHWPNIMYVYWLAIDNLDCVVAYYWSFVLYDYEELT